MKVRTQEEVYAMSGAQLARTSGYLRVRSKEWFAAWRGLVERTGEKGCRDRRREAPTVSRRA